MYVLQRMCTELCWLKRSLVMSCQDMYVLRKGLVKKFAGFNAQSGERIP